MARKISSRLEDLDLSQDELKRLGEALKKEEFRKLLFEYVREINDPVNKKRFEDEITQLENERGVDIKFVHPEPQYVLKTCFNPGGEKVFVNICSNSLVGKPIMKPSHDSKGASGISWSVPLIHAPPREDLDKSGMLCTVYDVLFHSETHVLAARDKRIRSFVEETALNAVEETFSVKLDRNSIKRPRMKFKGTPQPTVIRSRRPEGAAVEEDPEELINQFPYPYKMPPKEVPRVLELKQKSTEEPKMDGSPKQSYVSPKYVLKQSSDVDMSNYEQNHLSHHDLTVPQRLILTVDLPHVKSSSELELDVEEQKVLLVNNGKRKYKLDLKLPYPVQEDKGNAKFDQEAAKLIVTLVVDREKVVMKKFHVPEGDSGIESDVCCGRVSSSEEEESKAGSEGIVSDPSALTLSDEVNPELMHTKEVSKDVTGTELERSSGSGASKKLHDVDIGKSAVLLESNLVKIPKELVLPGKTVNEEVTNVSSKALQVQKSIDNMSPTTEKDYESSVTVQNSSKHCRVTQGLLLPEVPYSVPIFTCNCLQESEYISITFILQAKNVDPLSVNKKVVIVAGILNNTKEQKSVERIHSDDISLAPESGSVHNEYWTERVSCATLSSQFRANDAEVSNNMGSKDTSNDPAGACSDQVIAETPSVEETLSVTGASASREGARDCDTSRLRDSFPEKEVEVNGAKFSMLNTNLEDKLSNKFRDNNVIKEGGAGTEFQADRDSLVCDQEVMCFHVTFSSIGAGFFPQNYAFCVCLPTFLSPSTESDSSDAIPFTVEVWDNNVEVQLQKAFGKSDAGGKLDCFVGKDPSSMLPYDLPAFEEKALELESFSEAEYSSLTSVSENLCDDGTKDESDSFGASKENQDCSGRAVTSAAEKRKIFKERTLSESSVESITAKQATKGILKRRGRVCLGRSLSESSGGEEYSWIGSAQHLSLSSSITSSPSLSEINRIPMGDSLKEEAEEYDEDEEDDDEDGEKVKKIVRFSDVISQKTYRCNSSILGQRKKNQRKTKNKKRAAERRASESENSVDEVEASSDKTSLDSVSDLSPPQKNEIPLPSNRPVPTAMMDSQPKGKPKGSSKKKGSGNKGKGKKFNEPPKSDESSGNPNSPQYEFKSDLIFQLEL